jgi:hypothetical protein
MRSNVDPSKPSKIMLKHRNQSFNTLGAFAARNEPWHLPKIFQFQKAAQKVRSWNKCMKKQWV